MSEHCYHCGDDIVGRGVHFDNKQFCCTGCKSVYKLLSQNDLGDFYRMQNAPGSKPETTNARRFDFLEVDEIKSKFIDFSDEKSTHVTLYLPKIHCSSCIYLLENLNKLDQAVKSCQVNFAKRSASIVFEQNNLSFSELALLLDKIGYPPNFSSHQEVKRKKNLNYLFKLGVAGFAFGSIMLWTFPEYLGVEEENPEFRNFTSYLSLIVSIPVLFYSANEFLISAFKALRYKSINLDVPISLGIIALYAQSTYNIIMGLGPGYMDSFAGFIFFLLIGKWFQSKTYDSLSFERDYRAYFPVAITLLKNGNEQIVEIDTLRVGDRILVRNDEVIPCDVKLISKRTKIDYSFVTGESELIQKEDGELVYAGGKNVGNVIECEVLKESSRSHLTQLWNESLNQKKSAIESDKVSVYFLIVVLIIAALTAVYHLLAHSQSVTEIVVAVLIVACPCALALSKPFTYGNIMRMIGRKGLYLKNSSVIPRLNSVSDIVFDKTGTLTTGSADHIQMELINAQPEQLEMILVVANASTHPLSRSIVRYLRSQNINSFLEPESLSEYVGQGVHALFNGIEIRIGSASFVGFPEHRADNETSTHVAIDAHYHGKFVFDSELREGIRSLIPKLEEDYSVHILSGDRSRDLSILLEFVGDPNKIRFEQSPKDKLEYIQQLKANGKTVLMIGDGLNDAGALEVADVGIAVSEDIFRFTPSSDAIIKADRLVLLDRFLQFSGFSKIALRICYVFSLTYNLIGLFFAVTGSLTPLIAAILMPLSSITVVSICTLLIISKRL